MSYDNTYIEYISKDIYIMAYCTCLMTKYSARAIRFPIIDLPIINRAPRTPFKVLTLLFR